MRRIGVLTFLPVTGLVRKGRARGLVSVCGLTGALLLSLCSCGSSHSSAGGQASSPYVIGESIDLTGPAAVSGVAYAGGLKDYIDYLNRNGGVNGRKIDLKVLDDQDSVTLAPTIFTQLVDEGALGVFGYVFSSTSDSVANLATKDHVATFALGGDDKYVIPVNPWHFRISMAQSAEPPIYLDEIAALAKAEGIANQHLKIVIFIPITPADTDLNNILTSDAAKRGWSVKVEAAPLVPVNVAPEAAAIAADKPNFVIVQHNDLGAVVLVKGLRSADVTVPVIGWSDESADATFKTLGPGYIAFRELKDPSQTNDAGVKVMMQRAAMDGTSNKATNNYFSVGYISGELIQKALEVCGKNCTPAQFAVAAGKVSSLDTDGIGYHLGFSPTSHDLSHWAQYYEWNGKLNAPTAVSGWYNSPA